MVPICRKGMEMQRMDLCTQWEKERVRQTENAALTHANIYTIVCKIDN